MSRSNTPQLVREIGVEVFRFERETFYGSKVGVYGVNTPEHFVLIDVPLYTAEKAQFIRSFGKPVRCILTHGPTGVPDGVRWQKMEGVKFYMHEGDLQNEWLALRPEIIISGKLHAVDGLTILHTPGHTAGSICILHQSSGTLFSGDSIGGTERGVVRDFMHGDPHNEDAHLRLQSISQLLNFRFEQIMPFHYSAIVRDGYGVVEAYVRSQLGAKAA